jgi:DNA-binding NtrC family response regulator
MGDEQMPGDLVQSLRIDAAELPDESLIFGATAAMRDVQRQIERILHTDLPVVIRGESGTGKEVIARFLHARSSRRDLPFVKVNCGAISAASLERGLFPGALGGASSENGEDCGLEELARGGTLFFDEIADMDWSAQTKLLCLLEDGPLACGSRGGTGVRVVCATKCDLESAVERRSFRRDLFYRIDVISLHLKPLRERREDIPRLCEHFLDKLSRRYERTAPLLAPVDLQMLQQWSWPGNLRELENRIARAIVFGESHFLAAEPAVPHGTSPWEIGLDRSAETAWRAAPRGWNEPGRGNRRKASGDLTLRYRSFLARLREAGMSPRRRSPRAHRWRTDPPAEQ